LEREATVGNVRSAESGMGRRYNILQSLEELLGGRFKSEVAGVLGSHDLLFKPQFSQSVESSKLEG
jgi:hypothetical protein